MAEEILTQVSSIPPKEKAEQVITQQKEIIESLTKTADSLQEMSKVSHEKFVQTTEKVATAIKKLEEIKRQLTVITNRVNELKKISFPEPTATPEEQENVTTPTESTA